jgi:hypothetical protein
MKSRKANKVISVFLTTVMFLGIIAAMPFSAAAVEFEQVFAYPERGYSVTYTITSSWNNGQNNNARVTITNTGTEVIENWMLAFDFMGAVSMQSGGSIFTSDCGVTYVKNMGTNMSGYNDSVNINPGMSVRFEYSLNNPTGVPDSFELRQQRVVLVRADDYEIEMIPRPNTDWGTQFQGDFLIHNLSNSPIEFWEMTFVSNNFMLQNSWERVLIPHGDNRHTIKPVAGNILRIAPNSTLTLGFQANKDSSTGFADLDVVFVGLTEVVFGANDDEFPETDCRFGGIIAAPVQDPNVNDWDIRPQPAHITNGNAHRNSANGTQAVLDIDVLALIEGTAVGESDVFGVSANIYNIDGTRQVYIYVNGVRSPRFATVNPLPETPTDFQLPRSRENVLTFMNPAAEPIETIRVRANNQRYAVTDVFLLGEDGGILGVSRFTPAATIAGVTRELLVEGEWGRFESFVECGVCSKCRDENPPHIFMTATYDNEEGVINISWTPSEDDGIFAVEHSYTGNSDDFGSYSIPGTRNGYSYEIQTGDDDFQVYYFRVVQTMNDGTIVTSNIAYVIWFPSDVDCWTKYARPWSEAQTFEVTSDLSENSEHFNFSVRYRGAGIPDLHLSVDESGFSNAISNEAILGIVPELMYRDGLNVNSVTISFEILCEEALKDEIGTPLSTNPEFRGIRRFNIFKYFEDVNMLLPIETGIDSEANIVYTTVSGFGTYALVDMDIWLNSLGVDLSGLEREGEMSESYGIDMASFHGIQMSEHEFMDFESLFEDGNFDDFEYVSDFTAVIASPYFDIDIFADLGSSIIESNFFVGFNSSEVLSKVDIVFIIPTAGNKSAFDAYIQMILAVSAQVFTDYDARIYVITFSNCGYVCVCENDCDYECICECECNCKCECEGICNCRCRCRCNCLCNLESTRASFATHSLGLTENYFASFEEIQSIENIEFRRASVRNSNGIINVRKFQCRGAAFELLRNQVTFREGDFNFVYDLQHASASISVPRLNAGYDRIPTIRHFINTGVSVRYSEISWGVEYVNAAVARSVIRLVIDSGGLTFVVPRNIINPVEQLTVFTLGVLRNAKAETQLSEEILMGMNWSKLNLLAPLRRNGNMDSDVDGLTDWEEVNSRFLEEFWCERGITEPRENRGLISASHLPTVWRMMSTTSNYIMFRYVNTNNCILFEILNGITVIPLLSDPSVGSISTSNDGISDLDKLRILPEHRGECDRGELRLNSDCDTHGCKPGILERYALERFNLCDDGEVIEGFVPLYSMTTFDALGVFECFEEYLDFYINYEHYIGRLRAANNSTTGFVRYLANDSTTMNPFRAYTVMSLFPELRQSGSFNTMRNSNPVELRFDNPNNRNHITMNIRIHFIDDIRVIDSPEINSVSDTMHPRYERQTPGSVVNNLRRLNDYHNALAEEIRNEIFTRWSDDFIGVDENDKADHIRFSHLFMNGVHRQFERNDDASRMPWPSSGAVGTTALEGQPAWDDYLRNLWVLQPSEYYKGNVFDFFPGINVQISVNFIPVINAEPNQTGERPSHYATKDCVEELPKYFIGDRVIAVWINSSSGDSLVNFSNSTIRMSHRQHSPHHHTIVSYQSTSAHEFAHTLFLADSYRSLNNGFEPISKNEFMHRTSTYTANNISEFNVARMPFNAGFMQWNHGMPLANDIEMILLVFVGNGSSNRRQMYTPVWNSSNNNGIVSLAIRERQLYVARNRVVNPVVINGHTVIESGTRFAVGDIAMWCVSRRRMIHFAERFGCSCYV